MKKILLLLFAAFLSLNLAAKGEQVVLVDMDYIMSAIPAYETANEQLDQISKKEYPLARIRRMKEKKIQIY